MKLAMAAGKKQAGKKMAPRLLAPYIAEPDGDWLTVAQAAQLIGYRSKTVHKWIHDGTLEQFGVRVYRQRRAASVRYFVDARGLR